MHGRAEMGGTGMAGFGGKSRGRGLVALCAFLALSATAQGQVCPGVSEGGQRLDHSDTGLWEAQGHGVLAGGATDIARCTGIPGFGYFATAPDFSLYYTATGELSLEISARSDCDTALLVNDPAAGWHFNDDGDTGVDPALWFDAAETGRYDIWVGTLDGELCEAVLVLETFD